MDTGVERERLGVELEAGLLRRLQLEWRGINTRYFKSALRPPVIAVVESPAPLACWEPEPRSLAFGRDELLSRSWPELLEAIKCEAVWQFVDERLSVDPRNRAPSFRRICRHLGIGRVARDHELATSAGEARLLKRVRKLLALARSPNRNEAETAATTARRLMFKFNIEQGEVEHPDLEHELRDYGYRHLGPPRGRLHDHDRRLAKILTAYFFVGSAWLPIYLPRSGRRGTVLEICGLETNLLMAEHVHDFLRQTAARLWADYAAKTNSSKGPASERLAFLAGVMAGFESKLARQDEQLHEQGLVWIPAPGLGEYFRRRNPWLSHAAPGLGGSGRWSAAYEQGTRAGQTIVLSQPVSSSSSGGGPPRALPAGTRSRD